MNCLSILTFIFTVTFTVAEIKLLNVLFRHGDRTPGNFLRSCPNCLFSSISSSSFYPMGLGGLTNEGKKRVYKLGKYLRKNYDKFLGEYYVPKEVEALSSDAFRTRMSLQLVLAGLYPPSEVQKWSDEIAWQPVVPSYMPKQLDTIFVPQKCEKYTKEYERVLASKEFQEQCSKLNSFLAKLRENMGKKEGCSLMDANHLYHTLSAQIAINATLPAWTNAIYPYGELRDSALLQYQLYGYNDKLKRLGGGVLLKKMIDDMRSSAAKKSSEKIHLYSGHELNIVMLMQALGLYKDCMPEYSSAVIVELHESRGQYYVKILYYHGIPLKVDILQIPGCAKSCPLDQFVQLLQHVTPTDEDLNCRRIDRYVHRMKSRKL